MILNIISDDKKENINREKGMGLFDKFKKNSAEKIDEEEIIDDEIEQTRCHHYEFVHRGLVTQVFNDPGRIVGILLSPDAKNYINWLLDLTNQTCEDEQYSLDFNPEDIKIHNVRVNSLPCAVVEMPTPRYLTEAYFAALVYPKFKNQGNEYDLNTVFFYTLEYSFDEINKPIAILCEWAQENDELTHLNYGDVVEPELDKFIKAISLKVDERLDAVI
jgi:hypothetical protein